MISVCEWLQKRHPTANGPPPSTAPTSRASRLAWRFPPSTPPGCGGRSRGPPRAGGWPSSARGRTGSAVTCSRCRGTPGRGSTSTAASRTCRCRAGSCSRTSAISGCTVAGRRASPGQPSPGQQRRSRSLRHRARMPLTGSPTSSSPPTGMRCGASGSSTVPAGRGLAGSPARSWPFRWTARPRTTPPRSGSWLAVRTSTPTPPRRRTAPGSPGSAGTTPGCRGTAPNSGSRHSTTTCRSATRASSS